jgi:anaerobic glycerol-3-phosphate dehydrogenase
MEVSYETSALRALCMGEQDGSYSAEELEGIRALVADFRAALSASDLPWAQVMTDDPFVVTIAGTGLRVAATLEHISLGARLDRRRIKIMSVEGAVTLE